MSYYSSFEIFRKVRRGRCHIAPATQSDDTEIQCEFDGTQWADVGIGPYANLENFHMRIEKLPRFRNGTGGAFFIR